MNDSPLSTRRGTPGVALLLALTLAVATVAARRVPADNVLRDFQRTGDYVLVVNGKAAAAEIYQSQRAAATLIISSTFPSPRWRCPPTAAPATGRSRR